MLLVTRHLSKSDKTGGVVREVKHLSNLKRVCTDCANEFVVPQQSARSSFPLVSRADYVNLYSFKMDHRKCLLLSDLRECQRRRAYEQLEHEAQRKGTTARLLWEERHVRGLSSDHGVVDPVRAFFEEEDEEELLLKQQETEKAERSARLESRVQWIPVQLVFEQPGEEWAPDSLETVARRNLQLLQQLGLARVIKTENGRVGFVETLEDPAPVEAVLPVSMAGMGVGEGDGGPGASRGNGSGNGRRVKSRRLADDEDDYEEFKESNHSDEESSGGGAEAAVASPPAKRGRKKKPNDDSDFDDEDDFGSSKNKKKKADAEVEARKAAVLAKKSAAAAAKKTKQRKPAGPFKSYFEMASDPDLVRFLSRYGYNDVRQQGSYRLAQALFDCAPQSKDDGEEFLPFKKNDEFVIGYWSEVRGWSVVLLIRDPFDFQNNRRKWGLIPNVYVKVCEIISIFYFVLSWFSSSSISL